MLWGRCNSQVLKMTFFRQNLGKYKKFWHWKANFGGIWSSFPCRKGCGAFRINTLYSWSGLYAVLNISIHVCLNVAKQWYISFISSIIYFSTDYSWRGRKKNLTVSVPSWWGRGSTAVPLGWGQYYTSLTALPKQGSLHCLLQNCLQPKDHLEWEWRLVPRKYYRENLGSSIGKYIFGWNLLMCKLW